MSRSKTQAASASEGPEGFKQVIALREGYYGEYREAGETFEVPASLNARWFIDAQPIAKPAEDAAGDLV